MSLSRSLAFLIFAVLLISGCGGGGASGSSNAAVPNVLGDTQASASTAISGAGLAVGSVTTQSSTTVANGTVISEIPSAGTIVARKSSVSLVVSSGPPTVAVPFINNVPQAQASSSIIAAGLVVGSVTTQSSLSIANGYVISSSPSENTVVPIGSAVDLVVSSGLPPAGVNYQISSDAVNDVAWEPHTGRLYLAIGSNAGFYPNCVIAFDPETGTITNSAFAGSEPSTLAVSDDGQYLYVGLTGANAVQRFRLPSLTLDLTIQSDADEFQPGASGGQPLFAQALEVAPGMPQTIGVARSVAVATLIPYGQFNAASEPGALEVFDNATARPYTLNDLDNANSLAWGADSNTLYGAQNLAQGTLVSAIATGNGTFHAGPDFPAMPGSFPDSIAFASGLIYDNSASVLNPATSQVSATYVGAAGTVRPDAANNRVFYASFPAGASGTVSPNSFQLSVFDLSTGAPLGTATIYNGQVQGRIKRMIRWGVDGLALVTAQGQLVVLSGSLIAPGGTDSPVGAIPGTIPSYTPIAATPVVPSVTLMSVQASDMVWDAARSVIYASIPGSAASNPNSILVINPTTGAIVSQTATAANPGPLAISDDGQYLYVGEPGAIQRFILPAMTLDITVTLSDWAGQTPSQLAVAPGNAHLFTASFTDLVNLNVNTWLINDSQSVGNYVNGGYVAWGPNANLLYALNNSGGAGDFYVYAVDSSGLSQTATGIGARFVTLNPAPGGIGMYYANGLLYSDTGAVYDPNTRNTTGTFSLAGVTGAGWAVGPMAVNKASNRAYAMSCSVYGVNSVCGNTLISFDLTTFVPVAFGSVPGFNGYALRLAQIGSTTFASLDPNGDIAIVSSAAFAR